ncbi:insulinase family protein [Bacteroidales bacterium OttesenSCG-928-J19]|nr:insulinase family protein [Bacteroidales bacterium OttesenSCG-928-J19]
MLLAVLFLLIACSETKYKTVSKKDVNGYSYEEVTNDPSKARIYTLENGLKVYLSKQLDEPRIQTIIAVRAGSKDEPRDNTGLAHYLEHMMFKGSNNFGTLDWEKEEVLLDSIHKLFEIHKAAKTAEERKEIYKQIDATSQEASKYAISNEYDKMIGAIGAGGTNAFTSYDMTCYINEIPSNEVERFLKLEYDRFSNLKLRLFHTELETVYEEFNMYQDMGRSIMSNKLFEGLFKEHPYKVDVIGLPEHLKTPSMNSVMDFQRYFYAPNNMAVCMTGDLDFEKTVQLVDKYFGQAPVNPDLKHPERIVEKPLDGQQVFEAATPDAEMMMVGYRSDYPAGSKENMYLELISSILRNGKAGIIDLDMIQKQRVLSLYAGMNALKDYGIFMFQGRPREGQSLEDISVLIQEALDKLKAGDFSDDLLEAVINNRKLSVIRIADSREACYIFMEAFINETPWIDYVSELDEMSKVTKQELVDFANQFFGDNYVTVYKRTGENTNKVTVEKPQITPITINRDDESEFSKELLAMKPEPIEPVFVDFATAVKRQEIKPGLDFYYTKNDNTPLYSLDQFINIAAKSNKKLALAFQYLPYLGTSKYSPEELKLEMYKLAMSFWATSQPNRAYVSISGLDETMPRSLELLQEIMNDAVVNKEAYDNLVADILKSRADSKLNKSVILRSGLTNYAKYGPENPFTDILSEEELRSIDPQELIDLIKSVASYQHGYHYYGPETDQQALNKVKGLKTPETLTPVPERKEYPELSMEKPVVYFVDYDMVQSEIMFLANDSIYDPALGALETMFNNYYGTSMNSVVFQEIREARGLAYSAYTYVSNPSLKGKPSYIQGYVGTQADKMVIAMDAFIDLLTNMKSSEKAFEITKESVINNLRTSRITKENIFWEYMSMLDRGVPMDQQKRVYEEIQAMKLSDLEFYFTNHVAPAQYSILIVGKKENIDFNFLKKFGEIKELSLEEVFNY